VSEENLARSVLPKLTAQGALDVDGLKRKFILPGRHITAALLARDDEALPISVH
jgi:hypothetical protein